MIHPRRPMDHLLNPGFCPDMGETNQMGNGGNVQAFIGHGDRNQTIHRSMTLPLKRFDRLIGCRRIVTRGNFGGHAALLQPGRIFPCLLNVSGHHQQLGPWVGGSISLPIFHPGLE